MGLYTAVASVQPHSAYQAPSAPATHQGPVRTVRSSQTMTAPAVAILSAEMT